METNGKGGRKVNKRREGAGGKLMRDKNVARKRQRGNYGKGRKQRVGRKGKGNRQKEGMKEREQKKEREGN